MKQNNPLQKCIACACSCVLIFILTSGQVEAARRSRVLSIALFASGMGLQLGSTLFKASAQDEYDAYLNAAIQADIQTHKDTFLARRNTGTIMSRAGLGCVGLAVLLSIYNQLDTPEPANGTTAAAHSFNTPVQTPRTRINGFANRLSQNTNLLSPRSMFQLLPHYDFQTHRASLRLLHHF